MTNTIKHVMTLNHNYCDELFIKLDSLIMEHKWKQALNQSSLYIDNILEHFKHEEEVLFPAFEAATENINGPCSVMKKEHQQIRDLLEEIKQAIMNRNFKRYSGLAEISNILIHQHNLKEENILYPLIDNTCTDIRNKLLQIILKSNDHQAA